MPVCQVILLVNLTEVAHQRLSLFAIGQSGWPYPLPWPFPYGCFPP